MTSRVGRIAALRRYPIKGLSPEPLDAVDVAIGKAIAGDRAFAIENGPSGFDPANPAKIPKTRFLCLARNARLAGLDTRYDPEGFRLTVRRDGATALEADLREPDGRAAVEAFFTDFMAGELNGPLKLLDAPGDHTFSDTSLGVLSLINRASATAIEDFADAAIDPLRFRGNLEIEGFGAWDELDWVGRELVSGDVRMSVQFRTVRCAATEVDPATAERNAPIPKLLMKRFGHMDCGVYVAVTAPGRLEVGAPIELV